MEACTQKKKTLVKDIKARRESRHYAFHLKVIVSDTSMLQPAGSQTLALISSHINKKSSKCQHRFLMSLVVFFYFCSYLPGVLIGQQIKSTREMCCRAKKRRNQLMKKNLTAWNSSEGFFSPKSVWTWLEASTTKYTVELNVVVFVFDQETSSLCGSFRWSLIDILLNKLPLSWTLFLTASPHQKTTT